MTEAGGVPFRRVLDDHDTAMAASRVPGEDREAALTRLADGIRMGEAATADLNQWTRKLRRSRWRPGEMRRRLDVERENVRSTARRILWGWPAIRLCVQVAVLWVQVHLILSLLLLAMLCLGILALVFHEETVAIIGVLRNMVAGKP